MNKDTLQNVIGALLTLVIGVLGFMLKNAYSDIEALKHDVDLHVARANQRLKQIEGEQGDMWNKYNTMLDRGVDMQEAKFDEHMAIRERITKLESK